MSEELKRCPFCGGEAFLWDEREFHDHKGWFAMCGDCDASGDTKPTQAEAIFAWNTRAQPEAAPVEPVAAREEYPLTAALWKREPYGGCPDGEWVLEIRGSINDTYFINRHTQPINTPAEDVAGLPSLYAHPPAAPTDALVEKVARLEEALEAVWKEATTMRNASKLVGPYPTNPADNRVWARSMYHAGKRIMEMLKPARAALAAMQEAGE